MARRIIVHNHLSARRAGDGAAIVNVRSGPLDSDGIALVEVTNAAGNKIGSGFWDTHASAYWVTPRGGFEKMFHDKSAIINYFQAGTIANGNRPRRAADEAGRAVPREEEERNREAAYRKTGISRDAGPRKATIAKEAVKQLNGIGEILRDDNWGGNAARFHSNSANNYLNSIKQGGETIPDWVERNAGFLRAQGWRW